MLIIQFIIYNVLTFDAYKVFVYKNIIIYQLYIIYLLVISYT